MYDICLKLNNISDNKEGIFGCTDANHLSHIYNDYEFPIATCIESYFTPVESDGNYLEYYVADKNLFYFDCSNEPTPTGPNGGHHIYWECELCSHLEGMTDC